MRHFLLSAIVIFLFAACAKVVPAISEYRINSNIYELKFEDKVCHDKSLKVAQAFSANTLMNMDIMYGVGEHSQYRYNQSKWVQAPNAAITSEIVNFMKATNIFSSVSVPKSRMKSDFVLETNIEDFMQYFDKEMKNSFVKIAITFSLIETKTNSVVATKSIMIQTPVQTLDAEGGVIALNKALKELLEQSGVWLGGICK